MPSIFTLEGPTVQVANTGTGGRSLGEGLVIGGPAVFGVAAFLAGALGYGLGVALRKALR